MALLWCNVGFALSQQQAIDQYLSDRKLDSIEGIWADDRGTVDLYSKSGSGYQIIRIRHRAEGSGKYGGSVEKGSESYYYGNSFLYDDRNNKYNCSLTVTISGNSARWTCTSNITGPISSNMHRLWPSDFNAHNAKFKTKEDIQEEGKVLVVMVNDAKKTCKVLGFEEESEKFSDCALKLYTQKVDELVAERQAANALMTQSQTSTTTQSSGSNVTTIYDPVRDSKALMQQGQKMLSGRCTLGVDC